MKRNIRRLLQRIAPPSRRSRWFRSHLIRDRLGLEIGPCHNGVAPRRDGWHVEIADHMDQAGLREKYQSHGMEVDRIEPVDHVWAGQYLPDLVGRGRFGWIVASHVAEHVPDLVRFLSGCIEALEPDGALLLALPDHRQCFDHDRHPSSLSQILESWEEARTRPTPGAIAEHHFRAVKKGGRLAWPRWWQGGTERVHSLEEAASMWNAARGDGEYHDVHVWCFTPESFARLLGELDALGLVKARIASGPVPCGHEFLVALSPR